MNLLGMKRKLLPYGMPLGGAMGALGGGSAAPAGGKSSGLGGRGYQAAPGFSQQPQVQQPQVQQPQVQQPQVQQPSPMGGMPISSVNSTTQANMMSGTPPMQGLQGGKSSGLGGLGYQAAPGFGQQPTPQQQMQAYQPQQGQPDMMGGMGGGFGPNVDNFGGSYGGTPSNPFMGMVIPRGMPQPQVQQPAMNHPMSQPDPIKLQAIQQDPRLMQMQQQRDQYLQSSPIAQQLNQLSSSLNGAQPTQAQLSQMQSLNNQLQQDPGLTRIHQQMQQAQVQPMQQQMTQGRPQQMSQQMQDYYAQDRINQANRGKPPMQQQPMQQQPMQQQMQLPRQQQPMQQPQNISGLQGLMDKMRGQQKPIQQPRQMPKFQSKALQFKPNTQNAQAALSRVKPSVQKQNQDAQAARIAELEAQIAAQQPQSYDYGGNGG